jgi:hypothetical protein
MAENDIQQLSAGMGLPLLSVVLGPRNFYNLLNFQISHNYVDLRELNV